jgi:hypothetical protein
MNDKFREIALQKGQETYIFRFDEGSHRAFLKVLGQFAADPNLSFSWYDAAVLCKRARHRQAKGGGNGAAALVFNRLG